jgi:hypothetical protein
MHPRSAALVERPIRNRDARVDHDIRMRDEENCRHRISPSPVRSLPLSRVLEATEEAGRIAGGNYLRVLSRRDGWRGSQTIVAHLPEPSRYPAGPSCAPMAAALVHWCTT